MNFKDKFALKKFDIFYTFLLKKLIFKKVTFYVILNL